MKSLEIITLPLGPVSTNCYLIADRETKVAAVIDPAWDGNFILSEAKKRDWRIGELWYTHAHFDHFGGAAAVARMTNPTIALHPLDRGLWELKGGATLFGFDIEPGPEPGMALFHHQILRLGQVEFEVRHTPGHTQGHVVFYCASEEVLFSGDLVFKGGVGRTDLPGGNWEMLVKSIQEQVYTLPEATLVLSGHGEYTSVGDEKRENPFVKSQI
jgi:hydroxyacylglutathione hydrolase